MTRLTRPDQPVGDAFWGKSLVLSALVCPRPFGSFEKGTVDHRAKDLPSEQNWQAQRRALKACTFYCSGYSQHRSCVGSYRVELVPIDSVVRSGSVFAIFSSTGTKSCRSSKQPISRSAWLRTTDSGSVRDDRRRSLIRAFEAKSSCLSRSVMLMLSAAARTSPSGFLSSRSTGPSALSPYFIKPRWAIPPVVIAPTRAGIAL